MADKSQGLVLDALRLAMAEPTGLPLFAAKSQPGLFAGNAGGKQAAELCQREGYLTCLRTEPRGRSTVDVCGISEKGLAFLLSQVDPTPTLEALVQSLENRHGQIAELLSSAQASERYLEQLKETVQQVLEHCRQSSSGQSISPKTNHAPVNGERLNGHAVAESTQPDTILLDSLRHWQVSGTVGDCPLPRLYRTVQGVVVDLSIGQFHDCLRTLQREQRIYLHPWTGPLYEIPEPNLALLVGHEVAYYASMQKDSIF